MNPDAQLSGEPAGPPLPLAAAKPFLAALAALRSADPVPTGALTDDDLGVSSGNAAQVRTALARLGLLRADRSASMTLRRYMSGDDEPLFAAFEQRWGPLVGAVVDGRLEVFERLVGELPAKPSSRARFARLLLAVFDNPDVDRSGFYGAVKAVSHDAPPVRTVPVSIVDSPSARSLAADEHAALAAAIKELALRGQDFASVARRLDEVRNEVRGYESAESTSPT